VFHEDVLEGWSREEYLEVKTDERVRGEALMWRLARSP
jgi:hypothetical protein